MSNDDANRHLAEQGEAHDRRQHRLERGHDPIELPASTGMKAGERYGAYWLHLDGWFRLYPEKPSRHAVKESYNPFNVPPKPENAKVIMP